MYVTAYFMSDGIEMQAFVFSSPENMGSCKMDTIRTPACNEETR